MILNQTVFVEKLSWKFSTGNSPDAGLDAGKVSATGPFVVSVEAISRNAPQ